MESESGSQQSQDDLTPRGASPLRDKDATDPLAQEDEDEDDSESSQEGRRTDQVLGKRTAEFDRYVRELEEPHKV